MKRIMSLFIFLAVSTSAYTLNLEGSSLVFHLGYAAPFGALQGLPSKGQNLYQMLNSLQNGGNLSPEQSGEIFASYEDLRYEYELLQREQRYLIGTSLQVPILLDSLYIGTRLDMEFGMYDRGFAIAIPGDETFSAYPNQKQFVWTLTPGVYLGYDLFSLSRIELVLSVKDLIYVGPEIRVPQNIFDQFSGSEKDIPQKLAVGVRATLFGAYLEAHYDYRFSQISFEKKFDPALLRVGIGISYKLDL